MQAQYRADYAGEFVVVESKWSGGKKTQTREWVPNPIENHHISGRAACVGSSADRHKFDYTRLQRHRGGLLSSKKLQTYGVGTIANEMRLDFVVETNPESLESHIEKNTADTHVIYTSASNCIKYPENFYLIPYNPKLLDLSSLAYLAAFDGHKEVFLLGYNKDLPIENSFWHLELSMIMNAYAGTRFFFVGESTNMYESWLQCANADAITYREFISYCDV